MVFPIDSRHHKLPKSPEGESSRESLSGPKPGPAAIELHSLSRRYGRHWALINLSLTIPQSRVVLVAGHNGSGKSTLFRVLAGALRPHHGVVRVLGHDAVTQRQELRQQVALLGHHSYTYDSLSARQNLSTFARLAGTFEGHDAIEELLSEVSLAERADDPVETFSAGMRKRIAFARLLLQRPRVVLLDEPYGALDPAGFDFVDGLIQRFRAQGATVLIASHLVDHVAPLSDWAVNLSRGQLLWQGPAGELPRIGGSAPSAASDSRSSPPADETLPRSAGPGVPKPVAETASPADSALLDSGPTAPSPAVPSQTDSSPTDSAETDPGPADFSPTDFSPTTPTQTDSSPTDSAETDSSPTDLRGIDSSPTAPSLTASTQTASTQTDSTQTDPAQTDPAPTEPDPAASAPTGSSQADPFSSTSRSPDSTASSADSGKRGRR